MLVARAPFSNTSNLIAVARRVLTEVFGALTPG